MSKIPTIPEGMPWIIAGTRAGIPFAWWKLGHRYLEGNETDQNFDRAADCFRKAARSNHPMGYRSLAGLIAAGYVQPGAGESAIELYLRAAELGDSISQHAIGREYCLGKRVEKSLDEATKWLQLAWDNGQQAAAVDLVLAKSRGFLDASSVFEFIKFLEKRAEGGDAESAYHAGILYSNGFCGDSDRKADAIRMFKRAMQSGYNQAPGRLAEILIGMGSDSYPDAMSAAMTGSRADDPFSMMMAGRCHGTGTGTPRDLIEARKWLSAAAKTGYPFALNEFADFLIATNAEQDREQIRSLLKEAIAAGNGKARRTMGSFLVEHYGDKANSDGEQRAIELSAAMGEGSAIQALVSSHGTAPEKNAENSGDSVCFWLFSGAEDGEPYFQYRLGCALLEGIHTDRDATTGLAYLQYAAAQDYAPALCKLGYEFERGRGLVRNPARAARYYERAARLGDSRAAFNLGKMYEFGYGLRMDYGWSEVWKQRSYAMDLEECENSGDSSLEFAEPCRRKKEAKVLRFSPKAKIRLV